MKLTLPIRRLLPAFLPAVLLLSACSTPGQLQGIQPTQEYRFPGASGDAVQEQASALELMPAEQGFAIQSTATSLTLVSGGRSYTLSATFFQRLRQAIVDGLLNKSDIDALKVGSTASEVAFLGLMPAPGPVTMPNLRTTATDPLQLSFASFAHKQLAANFLTRAFTLTQDGVLTLADAGVLNQMALTSDEKTFAEGILYYDTYSGLPLLNTSAKLVSVVVKSYYDEPMVLPGATASEWLTYLGQGDRLSETTTDGYRCMASAIINHVLLNQGLTGFKRLATSLGTPADSVTYRNLHLLQHALYSKTGAGTSGLGYSATSTGQLVSGTTLTALKLAGVNYLPTLLPRSAGSYQTTAAAFFQKYPGGGLLPSVYLNNTGALSWTAAGNHAVLVTRENGVYYVHDSGQRNGKGVNRRPLTAQEQTQWFSSTNPNPVLQVLPVS